MDGHGARPLQRAQDAPSSLAVLTDPACAPCLRVALSRAGTRSLARATANGCVSSSTGGSRQSGEGSGLKRNSDAPRAFWGEPAQPRSSLHRGSRMPFSHGRPQALSPVSHVDSHAWQASSWAACPAATRARRRHHAWMRDVQWHRRGHVFLHHQRGAPTSPPTHTPTQVTLLHPTRG